MLFLLLFMATLLIAWFNGANDNFKGVATLYGSGTTGYGPALRWATFTTLLGSVASLFFAQTLLVRFSGKGLVPDAILGTPEFMIAVGLGAGLTVLIATFTGFPISTTHSLTGALAGAGLAAVGLEMNTAALGTIFFLPLVVSPMLAIGLGGVSSFATGSSRVEGALLNDKCICAGKLSPSLVASEGTNAVAVDLEKPFTITTGDPELCRIHYGGQMVAASGSKARDLLHYFSSGLVSFARGLNDTPKIMGLLLAAEAFDIGYSMLAIAGAMAAGGLINARKVAEVMSHKISGMNEKEGVTANLITALLVIGASRLGIPVSTTHVSAGSIFGTGLVTGKADKQVFSGVFASWVLTLPVSALIAGTVYLLF